MKKIIASLLLLLAVVALTAQTPSGSFDPNRPIDAGRITSGVLTHERGGLEADVSAYTGIPGISGGVTYDLNTLAELNAALGSNLTEGGGAHNFSEDPDLEFWVNASSGTWQDLARTTPALDGDVVRAWDDLSGNGYHLSENSTNNIRLAGGQRGLTRSFIANNNGGTGKMVLTSGSTATLDFSNTDPRTYFARFSIVTPNTQNWLMVKDGPPNGGWNFRSQPLDASNNQSSLYFFGSGALTEFAARAGSYGASTVQETWIVYDGSEAAPGIQITINGVEQTESTSTVGVVVDPTNTGVFTIMGDAGSDSAGINIEEMAIFSRALTQDEILAFTNGQLEDSYGDIHAAQITQGVLADARVQESNVTQHEAALALDGAQITSGVVTHERGGLEADVSAYDGIPAITAGATYELDTLGELNTALGTALAEPVDSDHDLIIAGSDLYLNSKIDVFEDTLSTDPAENGDSLERWNDPTNGLVFERIGNPSYASFLTEIGNNPTVIFDNAEAFESTVNALDYTGSQPWSMFFVFEPDDLSFNNWFLDHLNQSDGIGYGVGAFGEQKVSAFVCSGSGLCAEVKTTNDVIANNTWNYVIVTYTGSRTAAGISIYVGSTVSQALTTTDDDNGTDNLSTYNFGVGTRADTALDWHGGQFAEAIVSPVVWSVEEIAALDTYACAEYNIGCEVNDHTHDATDITSGVLAHERGGLEADVSAYSGIPFINAGATSELDTLAELNTALGTTLTDFGSSVGPTELAAIDFGDFTCNGTLCTVDTLDWTSDLTEGTSTGAAVFDVGVAKVVTSLDGLSNYFTDMAANLVIDTGDILIGVAGVLDDQAISAATEANVAITNLSDVTITGIASGDTLIGSGTTLVDRPILNFDTDLDTALSSTSSTTPADIPGLIATLPGGTNGTELVVVTAQINYSNSTSAVCQFQIIQDVDSTDTPGINTAFTGTNALGAGAATGLEDVITLVEYFAPPAGTVVNYTVEWAGNGTNLCYQDNSSILAIAHLDQ